MQIYKIFVGKGNNLQIIKMLLKDVGSGKQLNKKIPNNVIVYGHNKNNKVG